MLRLLQPGNWSAGQVSCHWTANTRTSISEVESAIDQAWTAALARPGVYLFDGPMCRLESWQASDTELELQLSSTSYKVFLGTNMSHPEFADIYGPAVMANPVGLSAPVITVDQQLLLGFRNNSVAYYPHRVHPFAGSLEPTDFDVFSAITRELREELSLSAAEIVELRCTGITEDASLRQPELIFAAELALTESEIDSRLDRQEHSSLWRIPATAGGVHAAIASDTRLTPVGLASLLLWGKFRYGSRWYQEAKSAIAMA